MIPLETISELGPDALSAILDSLSQSSSIGLAVFDSHLRFISLNASFGDLSGADLHASLGKHIADVVRPEFCTAIEPLVRRGLLDNSIAETVLLPRRPGSDLGEYHVELKRLPIKAPESSLGVLLVIYKVQVTEKEFVKHQQDLLDEKERLELAISSGSLGTWQLSLVKEELIDASTLCKASFGFKPDEPLTFNDLIMTIHPDDLPGVLRAVDACRKKGAEYKVEYRVVWRDKSEHWISASAHPTFDNNGRPLTLIGISQDISARKTAEREKSELLAKISEFSAMQASFLRDVLASVTDGKLHFCQRQAELPAKGQMLVDNIKLTGSSGLSELRTASRLAAQQLNFSPERWQDLTTAASEAGMNAVVHAGGGVASVCIGANDCVQVWIKDEGKGIELENLPRATLEKGYTTTGTMGHGMKLMLQTADRVWLLTGPAGTALVIEQDREPLRREWI